MWKKHWPFIIVLGISLVLRVIHAVLPEIASWDGSVYVGMGKFLFSGGAIGVWEVLRPVGWPIILGLLWKVGIDPYIAGIVLVTASSLALITLVYVIGERMRQYAGLVAATLLSFAPVFFQYSTIPMTDISSTALAMFALYLYIAKRKIFLSGLFIGIACLFRFPQGLMLACVGLIILVDVFFYTKGVFMKKMKMALTQGVWLLAGFACVIAPFLIANQIFYGNPLQPFIEGNNIIKGFPELYHKGPWFYFIELFKQHWLVVLAFVPFVLFRKKYINNATVFVLIALCIYAGYFWYQPHKETRYMLGFLPYVLLFAGLGISLIFERIKADARLILIPLIFAGLLGNIGQLTTQTGDNYKVREFSTFFEKTPGARILSSSPFPALHDVLIIKTLYNDWNDVYEKYTAYRNEVEYVAVDSCVLEVACGADPICYKNKDAVLDTLEREEKRVFATVVNQCDMRIYKIAK